MTHNREIHREFADGDVVPGTHYRVLGLIGAGGMGSVYDVEHVELGKRFVLKSLLRELERQKDLVGRMRQEWRALARLEHPNIVSVTDAGTSATGVPFYVMERLEGETLRQLLRRTRPLPMSQALGIAAGVLDGLSAAHAIGVVHRDIKPANIFVLSTGSVKLLDFGIAKIASSSAEVVTARGLTLGTPRYMSPEQVRGDRVDGRADIYSVGLLLYEMLAGGGPFDDLTDTNELVLAQLTRVPAPLSSALPDVPPSLDKLITYLLAKEPRDRPPSAEVVARTLRQYTDPAERPALAADSRTPPATAAPAAWTPPDAVTTPLAERGSPAGGEAAQESTLVMEQARATPPRAARSWTDAAGNTAALPQPAQPAPGHEVPPVAAAPAAPVAAAAAGQAQPPDGDLAASGGLAHGAPPPRRSLAMALTVAAAAVVALLIVVGVGWVLLRAQHARDARLRAAAAARAAARARSASPASRAAPASSLVAVQPAVSMQPPVVPVAPATPSARAPAEGADASPDAAQPATSNASLRPHAAARPAVRHAGAVRRPHRSTGLPGSGL